MGKDPVHLFSCPKFSQRIHKNVLQQAHATVANCIFKVNFGVWEIGSEWLSFAPLHIDRRALFRSWDGLS